MGSRYSSTGSHEEETLPTVSDLDSINSEVAIRDPKNRPRRHVSHCRNICRTCLKRIVFCRKKHVSRPRLEIKIRATLLIQRWFRRYMARLEIKRRCIWTIFQNLEYDGEQDQVQLYRFYEALLHLAQQTNTQTSPPSSPAIEHDIEIADDSPDENECYSAEERKELSFTLEFPLEIHEFRHLLDLYRKFRHFHLSTKYVAKILKQSIEILKKQPNISVATILATSQITVCGDIHGKLEDLLTIFHKNGLPSRENPYVFNGDFVDRGKRGLEVLMVLLCCLIVYPRSVFLNRGNHEDLLMNSRYGFINEVQTKYRKRASVLLNLIESVYRLLPLGCLLNNKVLIVHGGIADDTDLEFIKNIDRTKYRSLLRPPTEMTDKKEWKQVFDILWSDPKSTNGCVPNLMRGGGCLWGPNVTKKFLEKHKLEYIVRSHECKIDGYDTTHDDKVITIFSASSYYEIGSNRGAYMIITGSKLEPHFVQFMANKLDRRMSLCQKVDMFELSALKQLNHKILEKKQELMEAFTALDRADTGEISLNEWSEAMRNIINSNIPWILLKDKLVKTAESSNNIIHSTTFDIKTEVVDQVQGSTTVLETLYANKANLEAIFQIIDNDNTGYITVDKFLAAWNLMQEHLPTTITKEKLEDLCKMMDLDHDGVITLNEFLESFRLVQATHDQESSPQLPERNSSEIEKDGAVRTDSSQIPENLTASLTENLTEETKSLLDIRSENSESIGELGIKKSPSIEIELNKLKLSSEVLCKPASSEIMNGSIQNLQHQEICQSPVLSCRKKSLK